MRGQHSSNVQCSAAPVDEVSLTVYELHQLPSQAAVKLLGPELDMQQHIQPLCSSQTLQLQTPVQTPQLTCPAPQHPYISSMQHVPIHLARAMCKMEWSWCQIELW